MLWYGVLFCYNVAMDDEYDEYDADFDDLSDDDDDSTEKLLDSEIELLGVMDGELDLGSDIDEGLIDPDATIPNGYGANYGLSVELDDLTEEQRDLYDAGYFS